MAHHWVLLSKTGHLYEGVDDFPTQRMKDECDQFELYLDEERTIIGPWGEFRADHILVAPPSGHRLVFKRRNRFKIGCRDYGDREEYSCNYLYIYIVNFERMY